MKKIIVIAVALLLIAGAFIVIRIKKSAIENTPAAASYPLPVDVTSAKEGSIFIYSHYLGTIKPLHYADIAPRISGNILNVYVREGDAVLKGQLLAKIDDRSLLERESAQALEIAATEAQLAGAKSIYETQDSIYTRDRMLQQKGAISLEALQKSKAARDSAESQVRSLEAKIEALKKIHSAAVIERSYASLYAPFDGVVTKRLMEPGDLAVAGKPILQIEGTSGFKVIVQVPQAELQSLKKGGKVILSNSGKKKDAVISRVYPAITVATMGSIEIDLPARPFDIPSGGTVGVDVITGKTGDGVIVPSGSLLKNQQGTFVYKVLDNKIYIIKVDLLGQNSESACVKGDIKGSNLVVIADEGKLLTLSEGMTVVPVRKEDK